VIFVLLVLASLVSAADPDCITLEDFSTSTARQFPAGWKMREESGRSTYVVQAENGRPFLRATVLVGAAQI